MENNRKIAITIGDVGGISPEIIIKSLSSPDISLYSRNFLVIGNKNLIPDLNVEIIDIPLDISKIVPGKPTVEAGKHSFLALKKACELAKKGEIRAIVTAPLSKEAINKAGYHYSGQTEILEEYLISETSKKIPFRRKKKIHPEMLFVAESLRVMLLTRHVSLNSVSSSLSIKGVINSILALNKSLVNDFKIADPKIAVCGLNPHSGEHGILGNEEDYIIKPALYKLRKKYGINIEGAFPADTLWAKTSRHYFKGENLPYDAYVACYHDQGLIPVKVLAMDKAVNTTINLPVIRTSPCHGTAYDIVGQNKADFTSMIEAIKLADALSSGSSLLLETRV